MQRSVVVTAVPYVLGWVHRERMNPSMTFSRASSELKFAANVKGRKRGMHSGIKVRHLYHVRWDPCTYVVITLSFLHHVQYTHRILWLAENAFLAVSETGNLLNVLDSMPFHCLKAVFKQQASAKSRL